ncbi:hypothetical protein DFQ30_003989 [Apophysomyces sp. BC1015]|nr:hypothetical protein DFQ30_003989 [Apophysomyces sp. BC1015]
MSGMFKRGALDDPINIIHVFTDAPPQQLANTKLSSEIRKYFTFRGAIMRECFHATRTGPATHDSLEFDEYENIDYDPSPSLPAFSKIKNRFRVFYEHLDFQKLGLEACERNLEQYSGEGQDPPPDVKYAFTNLIRTDGHAIEFIFAKQAPQQPPLPDLTMADFIDEDLGNFRVYGVDPGVTQLFTAEDEQFRVTQFANAEWFAKSGHRKRRWNQQIRETDTGVTTLESSLPTHKTARPTNWHTYCQALFNNFETLTSFYGNQWTNERFLSFLGRQKMENEVVNIFLSGGKKYPGRAIDNRLPVLAYGNGTFAHTRGGKGASHHGKVYRALKRAEQQGLLVLCLVNEAFTSQVCPLCQRRSLKLMEVVDTFSRRMVKLWSVKRCEECLHHWKRDHAAAMNIRDLGIKEQAGHDRPRVFCFGQDDDAMDVDAQAGNAMDMDLLG